MYIHDDTKSIPSNYQWYMISIFFHTNSTLNWALISSLKFKYYIDLRCKKPTNWLLIILLVVFVSFNAVGWLRIRLVFRLTWSFDGMYDVWFSIKKTNTLIQHLIVVTHAWITVYMYTVTTKTKFEKLHRIFLFTVRQNVSLQFWWFSGIESNIKTIKFQIT